MTNKEKLIAMIGPERGAKYATVLELRTVHTQAEIGEMYDCTRQRIAYIERDAKKYLSIYRHWQVLSYGLARALLRVGK